MTDQPTIHDSTVFDTLVSEGFAKADVEAAMDAYVEQLDEYPTDTEDIHTADTVQALRDQLRNA